MAPGIRTVAVSIEFSAELLAEALDEAHVHFDGDLHAVVEDALDHHLSRRRLARVLDAHAAASGVSASVAQLFAIKRDLAD